MKYTWILLLFFAPFILKAQEPALIIPFGHSQGIIDVKLVNNDKYLLTESFNDRLLRLWDIKSAKLLKMFSFNIRPSHVVRDDDGSKVFFNIEDSSSFIFDFTKNDTISFVKHYFDKLFFTPDGEFVVGIKDNAICKINIPTGNIESSVVLNDSIQDIFPLKYFNCFVVKSKKDNNIFFDIYDFDFRLERRLFVSASKNISYIHSYPDEIRLFEFTGSSYNKHVFNDNFSLKSTYKEDSVYGKPLLSAYSDKNRIAAFVMDDTTIQITDSNGQWKTYFAYFPNGIDDIIFVNNGKYFIVKSQYELVAFNTEEGEEISQLDYDRTITDRKTVGAKICVNTKEDRFYIVLTDNQITECVINEDSVIAVKKIKGSTENIDCAYIDAGLMKYVNGTGEIKDIDLNIAVLKNTKEIHNAYVAVLNKTNNYYITASSRDSAIKIWNPHTNNLIFEKKFNDWVIDVIASDSGNVLFIIGDFIYKKENYYSTIGSFHITHPTQITTKKYDKRLVAPLIIQDSLFAFAIQEDSSIHICDRKFNLVRKIKSTGWILSQEVSDNPFQLWVKTLTHIEIYDADFTLINKISINNDNGFADFSLNINTKNLLLGSSGGLLNYYSVKEQEIKFYVDAHKSGVKPKFINDTTCVSFSEDGVIKYWHISSTEFIEKYQLIPFAGTDYITIIPSGYYMGSKKGVTNLHYVTNNLRIISFDQLDIKYNRPDKVLEAIGNTDTILINSYKKAYQKRIKKLGIDTTQFKDGYSVPEADFINRDNIEYEQTKDKLTLKIHGIDSTYKLDRFNVWINEVPLFGLRGVKTKRKNDFDTTVTINLSQGENRIETSATNVNGTESYRMPLFVKYTPAVPKEENTHFIGIGINQFANPEYNLSWSVKDIRDLALKLKIKYPNIIIDTLFDKDVTKENILALKKKLLLLNEDDKVIVLYSGHGVLSKDFDYFLSTYSINFERPEEKGLAYDDLESLLDNIKPRKKLMLIDACHSGEVDKEEIAKIEASQKELSNNGVTTKSTIKVVKKEKQLGMANSFELMQNLFVNVCKGTGATIISAAGGMQYAQERGDLKNGVFTYSVLEAFNKHTTLKVSELKKIVGERVTQLTNGLQKPTSRNETNNYDWLVW